jgi:hypothetical protein
MKKYILTLCSALFLFNSCDLDINDNPNYPDSSTITPDLLFPSVQNFVAATSCDVMFNYAGFFAQYFDQKPGSTQFSDMTTYNIKESDDIMLRAYRNLYAGALPDIKDIMDKTDNTADRFAATVMRAFIFQLMVDNTDEAPYSEAIQGSSNASPKWDDGKDVYTGVLAELDEAEAALDASSDVMTLTDMMFDKNISQWKGYANALRLRMYLRMYDVDNSVQSKITALVAANNFFSGDAKIDIYAASDGNRSPFYASYYALGTGNHCAAYPIASYMNSTSDPRIGYALDKNGDGKYVGQIPGARSRMNEWAGKTWSDNDVSAVNYDLYDGTGVSRPAYLFTQANLQFLIAEVKTRFNNDDAGAKAAYEAAVKADFSARGISGADTFLASDAVNWDKASNKLNLIYMQKWVALFYMDNMEAWSEIRRTDVPALSSKTGKAIFDDSTIYNSGDLIEPTDNAIEAGGLIKRVPYPLTARNLNKNTPAAKTCDKRVWWDAK